MVATQNTLPDDRARFTRISKAHLIIITSQI